MMSTRFFLFPWVLILIAIGAFVKMCVSARGQCCMVLRIVAAFFVVLIVFPACYYATQRQSMTEAWFLTIDLVPPEFGMPTYEDEIELAFMIGSVAFSLVPLFMSTRLCAFLHRRFLIPGLDSEEGK